MVRSAENPIMKKFKKITIIILSMALMCVTLLSACAKEEGLPTWQISSGVTARFTDNGNYGFILMVEGSGQMRDYASAKDAPWYSKSGRITQIEVSDGVTYLGDNSFAETAVKSVTLPASVTAIGKNVFPEECIVYSNSHVEAADGRKITPAGETEPQSYKILFIGNSYTYYNDMPENIFSPLARAAGADVTVTSITTGSQNLSNWANPANSDGARVEGALTAANDYDIIVLQEQSFKPLSNYNGFLSGAKTLTDRIKATQKNCKVFLYETWGNPARAGEYGGSIPAMEAQLRTAYQNAAKETGASVSYVGKAFTYVYETYNLASLGKSSPMWLYQDDNTHPLYLGSYLAACVHLAELLNIDPKTSTFDGDLNAETAAVVKDIAYRTVFGN